MMKYLHTLIGISTLTLSSTLYTQSQVTTTAAVNSTQAVQVLLGTGTTPANVQYQGSASQLASFTTTGTNLPIGAGLIMSTGIANNPQLNGTAGNFLDDGVGGVDNNPLLNAISGVNTHDGAILQFDFVPVGDTMKFNYVFGSEEYNDFVDGGVNDAFGFFLSGPNPSGGNYANFNVALIPNTSVPVSINTVNNGYSGGCASGPCQYCQYYHDNTCGGSTIAPDGFTVLLTAVAPVTPCQTYTIKLAIGDGGDDAYDSWVFLEANSFSTGAVTIQPDYNFSSALSDTLIYEGCSDVTLNFVRDGTLGQYDTVAVAVAGTATNGVDYTSGGGLLPTQVVFAPGQTGVLLNLTPVADALAEGPETVTLTVTNITACGDTMVSQVTLVITDVQPMHINAGPDFQVCSGVPITSIPVVTGGVPPYAQPHWGLNTANNVIGTQLVNYVPGSSGMYIYSATNACNAAETAHDTIMVDIIQPQYTIDLDADSLSCFGTNDGSIDLTTNGPIPPFTYLWTPGNYNTQDLNNLGPGTYNVTVTDNGGCVVTGSVDVFGPSNIPINLGDKFVCSGDVSLINPSPSAGVNYAWSPASYFDNPAAASPNFSGQNAGPAMDSIHVVVYGTSPGACGLDSFVVYLSPLPQVTVGLAGLDTTALCPNDTLFLSNSDDNAGYPTITTQLWSNASTAPTLNVTAPGLYWLQVTNTVGCKAKDSLFVTPLSPPSAYIDSLFYICGTDDVPIFGVISDSLATLTWSTGASTDTILVNTGGTYTLIATNDCGSDTVSTQVIQIPTVNVEQLPNIFTPNGDGVNDVYDLNDLFYQTKSFNVKVFNRWGAKVYDTQDPQVDWAAKNLSDGVYFMAIVYTDCNNEEKSLAHTVTLIGK